MQKTSTTPNQNWFHIRYSDLAAPGLPPFIQAQSVVRYQDQDGTWLIALWERNDADNQAVSACILRLPEAHVHSVTRHNSLAEAASHNSPT